MKVTELDERIHVVDGEQDYLSVMRNIAESSGQEDPFYVMDIGDIVYKHKQFKQIMPRVYPYYAVKCNDSLMVIEILAALGTGFDCASKAEINKVMSVGVDSNRILFANPAKPSSHIAHAAAVGVDLMTFDGEAELYKVKKLHPQAKMVIRVRCDDENAQCQLGMKFGCDADTEAPRLLKLACTLGLDVVGVSFHVGSGCRNPPVFRRAIKTARGVFDYAKTLGYTMTLLDLGGGYPGDRGTSIQKIGDVVNEALADYFPEDAEVPVHVIAEPGRYYVSSAYTLACNVHSKREIKCPTDNTTISHVMYYINDGVYGSFNNILYDHYIPTPILMNENKRGKFYPSSIWGPTCDGLDKVIDSMLLPEIELGEWIYFENMGAYTLAVASPFNGFPVPKVHIIADEKIWLLLKDTLPLSEDHFVFGNTPTNIHLGLDIDGRRSATTVVDHSIWNMEPIEINLPLTCHMAAADVNTQKIHHHSQSDSFDSCGFIHHHHHDVDSMHQ